MSRTDDSQQAKESAIRDLVLQELDWNSLIDATQLDVVAEHGVVTLVGTVGSLAEKLVAQSATESLEAVRDVVSRIDVKRAAHLTPTDEELHDVLAHVLTWDALVPERDVGLDVLDGWVTLAGRVASESQRHEAERVISRIVGVRGIDNRIEVVDVSQELGEVRHAIDAALQRRAVHRSRKIDVIIDNGVVVLRGLVESPDQKRAIHLAVAHAPGVEVLSDELTVG